MRVSATWSDTPAKPDAARAPSRRAGDEILREAGFSADEIAALVKDGVTRPAPGKQD